MILDDMHVALNAWEQAHRTVPRAIVLPPRSYRAWRNAVSRAMALWGTLADAPQRNRFCDVSVRCSERVTAIEVLP